MLHEEKRALFRRSLELAKRKGHFKGERRLKLALDTTNILGQGAVKDAEVFEYDADDGLLRLS